MGAWLRLDCRCKSSVPGEISMDICSRGESDAIILNGAKPSSTSCAHTWESTPILFLRENSGEGMGRGEEK